MANETTDGGLANSKYVKTEEEELLPVTAEKIIRNKSDVNIVANHATYIQSRIAAERKSKSLGRQTNTQPTHETFQCMEIKCCAIGTNRMTCTSRNEWMAVC